MTDKEKIKAEIERYKNKIISNNEGTEYENGFIDALESVITLIDANHEEPSSKDLEEAAKDSGQRYFPDSFNIWARPNYEAMYAALAFKEGANWKEQQIMKGALVAVINSKENDLILYQSLPAFITKNGWHSGDKVKLIIIKED